MRAKDLRDLKRQIANMEKLTGVKVPIPVETPEDVMREAQSVLNYFTVNDGKWKIKTCETCNLPFSYNWNIDSIKHCSVPCMAEALRQIGLEWDPFRDPSLRWGKTVPAIVPAYVPGTLVQDQVEIPEDPLDNTDHELLM